VPAVDTNQSKIIYKKEHCKGPLVEYYTSPQHQIVFKNNIKINIKSLSDIYIGFKKQNKLVFLKYLTFVMIPAQITLCFYAKSLIRLDHFFVNLLIA